MAEECIFCKIASGEVPAEIVREDVDTVAFRDVRPQAPTHVLVVPKRHVARISELAEADVALVGKLVLAAKRVAEAEGIGEGYRLVLNCGESAGHVHLHLLGGRPMSWPPG